MNCYMFQASLYCEDCGEDLCERLAHRPAEWGFDVENEHSYDSADYPKGPYLVSGADYPDHCIACGLFLENPLTRDGVEYVRRAFQDFLDGPNHWKPTEVVLEWAAVYRDKYEELEELADKILAGW